MTKKIDKEKIKFAFEMGDLDGLEEIERQLKANDEENILLNMLIKLNYIVIETECEEVYEKYYTEVHDLYTIMLKDLFAEIEIDL